ncbi:TadE/TadG family type IV pilus assembly protein [Paraburkholderia aromaticivorans]|uniref:Pilus assembly protein TadE n=1 Tax=Paraburkholderia aromaticivorans TaxID=2026199 RepID=A0A248VKY0_9BURK|nr:TadE family protein [Paraburkholderia aromaticivorans]ASV99665.1 pilus assembly protein TadE [Paraburkholderia aromaticivorans]
MKPATPQRAGSPRRVLPLRRARAQRGATAVEFALVFPLFFAILYAIITFSLILVAQQNLTLAAEEGARAALNWQSNTSLQTALTNRGNAACAAAKLVAAKLVQSMQCTPSSSTCGPGGAMQCVNVLLTYNYQANPIVPVLPLLGIVVPKSLSSSATVQLNPENIQ